MADLLNQIGKFYNVSAKADKKGDYLPMPQTIGIWTVNLLEPMERGLNRFCFTCVKIQAWYLEIS